MTTIRGHARRGTRGVRQHVRRGRAAWYEEHFYAPVVDLRHLSEEPLWKLREAYRDAHWGDIYTGMAPLHHEPDAVMVDGQPHSPEFARIVQQGREKMRLLREEMGRRGYYPPRGF